MNCIEQSDAKVLDLQLEPDPVMDLKYAIVTVTLPAYL